MKYQKITPEQIRHMNDLLKKPVKNLKFSVEYLKGKKTYKKNPRDFDFDAKLTEKPVQNTSFFTNTYPFKSFEPKLKVLSSLKSTNFLEMILLALILH
jgi:hypothetical protein